MTKYKKYTILNILILLLLTSCGDSYDRTNIIFFEDVSEIKFPKELKTIETYDNAEFISCGVFEISKESIHYFKSKAKFQKIKMPTIYDSFLQDVTFPNYLLKDSSNYFMPKSSVIKWRKCNNCANITIYIDTLSFKMWCSVLYPDNSGDFCCNDTITNN